MSLKIKDVIKGVIFALNNMDRRYCSLSKIDYKRLEVSDKVREILEKEKFLERPFAYEFYHQFRLLLEKKTLDFGGPIIQGEVNKRYQHLFSNGYMPDFIIHLPNTRKNLAVIELKLASRSITDIEKDFKKIIEFKRHVDLKYKYGIEILIGDLKNLKLCKLEIEQLNIKDGEEVVIIEFNVNSWKVKSYYIYYKEYIS
ncbi:MAG: hypothetical protein ACTSVV_07025 [Promethearchaeota archaeon]